MDRDATPPSLMDTLCLRDHSLKALRNPLDVLRDDAPPYEVNGLTMIVEADLLDVPMVESRSRYLAKQHRLGVVSMGVMLDGLAITFATHRDMLVFIMFWA